jgi:hypothetical protein
MTAITDADSSSSWPNCAQKIRHRLSATSWTRLTIPSRRRANLYFVRCRRARPGYWPGTGVPEAGGLSPREAQAILHGLKGLDIIGGDVVEVAPQYDATTNTAMVGAQMLFEIFSLIPLNPNIVRRALSEARCEIRTGQQQNFRTSQEQFSEYAIYVPCESECATTVLLLDSPLASLARIPDEKSTCCVPWR